MLVPKGGAMLRPTGTGAPSLLRWTLLCAAAETVGMTASATAAKASQLLVGEPTTGYEAAVTLALIVAGGLVEGIALGVAQATGLRSWMSRRRRAAYVLVTVAVAGAGWAGASSPAAFGSQGGTEPPAALMLGAAVGLGLVMGAVLGGAQAVVLRGQVPRPWRWVTANVAAWAVGMPVVFVGAMAPGSGWSLAAVAGVGALTGLVAGSAVGLVTGAFLPSLQRRAR